MSTKVHLVKAMGFPVVVYGCESWTTKKAECQRIDAFELWCWRRLLDCKGIKLVNPKGNQSWIFIRRTGAETEAPIFWPPDVNNWLTGKDPDAGKDWRQEEKGMTEDEMVGWHHCVNGHEFEQAPRSWWWTGKSGMLQSMGLQRVKQDWVTELKWDQLPLLRICSSNRKCNQVHLSVINSSKSKICFYILIHLRETFENWGFIFLFYVSLNMYIFIFSKNKTAWCMHTDTHLYIFHAYREKLEIWNSALVPTKGFLRHR